MCQLQLRWKELIIRGNCCSFVWLEECRLLEIWGCLNIFARGSAKGNGSSRVVPALGFVGTNQRSSELQAAPLPSWQNLLWKKSLFLISEKEMVGLMLSSQKDVLCLASWGKTESLGEKRSLEVELLVRSQRTVTGRLCPLFVWFDPYDLGKRKRD